MRAENGSQRTSSRISESVGENDGSSVPVNLSCQSTACENSAFASSQVGTRNREGVTHFPAASTIIVLLIFAICCASA